MLNPEYFRRFSAIRLLKTGSALSAFFFLLLSCTGGAAKQETDFYGECMGGKITVWGEAPIFTSKAASRDKAKEDACRTAIRKCIGEQVAASSGVSDGQAVTSEIFSQAKGLCKNDQILEEQEYNLDTVKMLKVFVRYNVSSAALNVQINTMKELVGNPKVMVLIREEYNLAGRGKRVEGFTSRNAQGAALLKEFLASKGYTIIDSAKASYPGLNEGAIAGDPRNLPDELLNRAAQAGADVLIVGNLESNPQTIGTLAGTDFKSYNSTGNVSILALWGDGKVIGEYSQPSSGAGVADVTAAQASIQRYTVGSDKNWEKHPGGLARFIHNKLSAEWSQLTQANVIKLKIHGLDQGSSGTFRDDLVERTAVKKVDEISFNPDEIVWDVVYPGRSFNLAETLSFYHDDPRTFFVIRDTKKSMTVTNVKRGEITVDFK